MFEIILTALVGHGVGFVVIGGVAATVHGSARFTNDIDICYDTAPDNIERLVAILAKWHAYLRGVERGLPFIMDPRAFRTTPIMALTTDVGDIDVLDRVPGVGDYAAAVSASETARIGRVEFRALTLDALIASKQAVRRKKDVEQLVELEALRELRKRAR
jgi:predicted nucleotidyltransferase